MSEDPTKIKIQTNVKKEFDPTIQRMSGITAHGNKQFDVPFIQQITDNLWMGGCQKGLVLPQFFKHIISVYPWEQYTVKHEMESMLAYKLFDGPGNDLEVTNDIARWVRACALNGPTLIHCQAGLNRSALITAKVLMLEGMSSSEAIARLRVVRSEAVLCNVEFEEHLRSIDAK